MIHGFGLVLFAVAWLLPGHYFPWSSFLQEVAAACGAALIGLSCLVRQREQALALPAVALIALALAVVPMAQWGFGKVHFLNDALLPVLYLVAFALVVVASRALASDADSRFVPTLMAVLLLGACLSTVIALGQGLRLGWQTFVELLRDDGRPFANFTQPNLLATLLGLGLAATWWLYESRRADALGAWTLGLFLSLGLAMTQSRVGWAFMLLFVFSWAVKRRSLALRTSPAGMVAAVVSFLALAALWPTLSVAIDGSAVYGAAERVQSVGGRSVHWPAMWDAVWRQPLFGWGWMQVTAAQQAVALDHPPAGEWISYSHSLLLDLLVWNGAVIGLLLIAGGAAWIVSRLRGCSDIDSWAMLVAGGVIFTHALVEFPYAYAHFLLPLAAFVGVVEARHRGAGSGSGPAITMPRFVFATLGLVLCAMLVWLWADYAKIEEMGQRTRFAEAGYRLPAERQAAVPDVLLIDSQREFLRFRQTTARVGMSPEELANMRAISKRFTPPAVLLRYALAMGLNGEPAESTRTLRVLCQIWTEKNCEEGREAWAKLQGQFPQLAAVPFPVPPRSATR